MTDLIENNSGMGNPVTREEEIALALENNRKAHEEQQAMLIDALRRHGVQIVVEAKGSLVMVEDETQETVLSAPLKLPGFRAMRKAVVFRGGLVSETSLFGK